MTPPRTDTGLQWTERSVPIFNKLLGAARPLSPFSRSSRALPGPCPHFQEAPGRCQAPVPIFNKLLGAARPLSPFSRSSRALPGPCALFHQAALLGWCVLRTPETKWSFGVFIAAAAWIIWTAGSRFILANNDEG